MVADLEACNAAGSSLTCVPDVLDLYASYSDANRAEMLACTTIECWSSHLTEMLEGKVAFQSVASAGFLLAEEIRGFEQRVVAGIAREEFNESVTAVAGLNAVVDGRSFREFGEATCGGTFDQSCLASFRADLNRQILVGAGVNTLKMVTPWGTIVDGYECATTQSAGACAIAVASIVPVGKIVAVSGRLMVKQGKKLVEALWVGRSVPKSGRATWTQISSDARAIVRDIEDVTGIPLPKYQRDQLANQLREVNHRIPVSDAEYVQLQREYRRNRAQMVQDWELNTAQTWPEGAQLHHITPQRYGGPNKWWNAHPALPPQHQGGTHGAGSPTQSTFPTPVPSQ